MKEDWENLGTAFEGSSSVVIGDVDCTIETELASEYGVSGYPTIKYFTGETDPKGDAYNGARKFDDLKTVRAVSPPFSRAPRQRLCRAAPAVVPASLGPRRLLCNTKAPIPPGLAPSCEEKLLRVTDKP
jgi:hypothetical protein